MAVEGVDQEPWKNFTFRMLRQSDMPELREHLRENFYPDEPVSVKIGQSEAKFVEYDMAVCDLLDTTLSFAAFDLSNGKMAAVRTIKRHRKGEAFIPFTFKTREMRLSVNFLTAVDDQCDIFGMYDVKEYAGLRVASVGRPYRSQGLATEMYRRTLNLLKASGFEVVKSVFTSPHSRKAAAKFGFQELGRKYFREIQDENGEFLCPEAGDAEFAAVMALRI